MGRRLADELDLRAGGSGAIQPATQEPRAGQIQCLNAAVIERDTFPTRRELAQGGFDLIDMIDAPAAAQAQRRGIARSFRFE